METKELQELLKLINRLEFGEFKYKQGDIEFSARTKHYQSPRAGIPSGQFQQTSLPQAAPVLSPPPAQAQSPSPANAGSQSEESTAEKATADNLIEIRSPIVGTFYRSGSPDKPPYVKPGDAIEVGSVVCIVEAMKLFNEIESEVSGKIVKVVVEDASPVEYDQLLFLVDPNG